MKEIRTVRACSNLNCIVKTCISNVMWSVLCRCVRPTIQLMLSGCTWPVALSQEWWTYHHDQVLSCLPLWLLELLAEVDSISTYTNLPGIYEGMWVSSGNCSFIINCNSLPPGHCDLQLMWRNNSVALLGVDLPLDFM